MNKHIARKNWICVNNCVREIEKRERERARERKSERENEKVISENTTSIDRS